MNTKKTMDFPFLLLLSSVLWVGASSRLSFAILLSVEIVFVYCSLALLTALIPQWFSSTMRTLLQFILATCISFIFIQGAFLVFPIISLQILIFYALVPLVFINSIFLRSDYSTSIKLSLISTIKEAFILCGVLCSFALVREPLGFGSLSIPSASGIVPIMLSTHNYDFLLQTVSVSFGALIAGACTIAFYRLLRSYTQVPASGELDNE